MILCTGFYYRSNLGDDIFQIIFNFIFTKLNLEHKLICLDDCKEIPINTTTIILGGGEILNKYFLEKLQCLCEKSNFNGKIIAYSCELPIEDIIPEVNIIDWFILRNINDVNRLKTHFNSDKFIKYIPDLVFSLNKKDFISESFNSKQIVTVCLARSIFKGNKHYKFYLKKIVLFLKYIYQSGYSIYLLPFNTSNSEYESDLFINKDIAELCDKLNFKVNNIIPKSNIPNILLKEAIQQINSSYFTICSRYHAHILSIVCSKPIISIPHTKKVKEQIIKLGLDNWSIEPKLDDYNRPIDFDVQQAIKLFSSFNENFIDIQKYIESLKFPTLTDHITKIVELLSNQPRDIPPFYVYQSYTDILVNQTIKQINKKFNINNFTQKQNQDITERVTRFILYILCSDYNSQYYWGLSQKIFKPNFNVLNDLKWLCNDYWSKKKQLIFNSDTTMQPKINKIFNLTYIYPHLLENIHRSGWFKVVHNTGVLHNPDGIIFDMFLDKTFHWGERTYLDLELLPYNRPWVGIVHHTPNTEYTDFNTSSMILKESWKLSLPNCVGIYTMSNWLMKWFNENIPTLNVETLIHPTEIPEIKFCFNKFMENPNKKLIQIGGWLRNPYSIYRIKVPKFIQKAHLIGKNMENYIKPDYPFINLIGNCIPNLKPKNNISSDITSNKYVYFMNKYIEELINSTLDVKTDALPHTELYIKRQVSDHLTNFMFEEVYKIIEILELNHNSVQLISTLIDDEYDKLLSNNIVFIDLIELSACNTLLECIVRNTPIVIKPLEPVVERLGANYPLFWNEYEDISKILTLDNIKKAHEYLKNLDKTCYSYDYWINSIINSNIFKQSQTLLYPFNELKLKLLDQIVSNKINQMDNIINKTYDIVNQTDYFIKNSVNWNTKFVNNTEQIIDNTEQIIDNTKKYIKCLKELTNNSSNFIKKIDNINLDNTNEIIDNTNKHLKELITDSSDISIINNEKSEDSLDKNIKKTNRSNVYSCCYIQ